jgi:ERCC4-type nuclease
MTIELIVDCREKKVIDELHKHDIPHSISQLPLADFVIREKEETIVLFERKTLADLESSILDGRYKEQGQRLLECPVHNHQIIYIVEGDLERYRPKTRKMKRETLRNAMISCMVFKGFSLVQTNSVRDTVNWLKGYLNKIQKERKKGNQVYGYRGGETNETTTTTSTSMTPSTHVGKRKNSKITKETIDKILLQQIPYLSEKSANAILEHFKNGTFYDIIHDVRENDAKRVMEVKVNGRRISKRIIKEMTKLFSHSLE